MHRWELDPERRCADSVDAVRHATWPGSFRRRDRDAISAGVEAGTIAPIPAGAMHFILSGPDRDQVELLIVIRLPDATEGSTGLSTESSADQAWLMFPGTHQAHVMIGSPPYGWSPNK